MASFTGVGDNLELLVPNKGEVIDIDLSGTYDMQIDLQREVGSPGSGSWETVSTQTTTANATIANTYSTRNFNETIRLIVIVDTSGTCTATLTDNDNRSHLSFKDQVGNELYKVEDDGFTVTGTLTVDGATTLTGATTQTGALTATAAGTAVTGTLKKEVNAVTAAVTAAAAAAHANEMISLDNATGFVYELPAATGSGDVFEFILITTVTSGTMAIECTEGAAFFRGALNVQTDASGIVSVPDGTTHDFINMNGSTTGGVLGSYVRCVDAAVDVWVVSGTLVASGAESTPFATS